MKISVFHLSPQDVVLHLLENGSDIDMKNGYKQTPLFAAIEGLHKEVAHVSLLTIHTFKLV